MATVTDFGQTSNLKSAPARRQGKSLVVRTVVQTLKPRRYQQVGKPR